MTKKKEDSKKQTTGDILNTLGDLFKKLADEADKPGSKKGGLKMDVSMHVIDLRKTKSKKK